MEATKTTLCDPEELAALARAGDLEVLDRMTRCYGERLLAMGMRTCKDPDKAKDAVQMALLGAGEHLTSWRGDGRLDSWLVRMVVNACHRMRRGRKNDPHLHDPEAVVAAAEDDDPEVVAARAQLSAALGDALLELPHRDRTIVLLSDVEGWTGPEIAQHLDMTPGSVRTRLSRARARLRERLADLHAGLAA